MQLRLFAGIVVLLLGPTVLPPSAAGQIRLAVDASEVTRRIVHAELIFPARPGAMKLVYTKWIPGEHGPTGPIAELTGLKFTVDGKAIPWQRDAVDMFAFELQVPAGATRVKAELDLVGIDDNEIFHLGYATTSQLSAINWNQVLLYPPGEHSDKIMFSAAIRLPAGWKFSTALPVESQSGNLVTFRTVSLTTLVDSPLIAGIHFREIPITPAGESRPHFLDITADSDAALALSGEVIAGYRNLVTESGALFGARHYQSYRFLVSLHGTLEDGLEHHQSSDNRLPEMALVDPELRRMYAYLLPHEMVHSWNGKYRRPIGLATSDYQQPMIGDLLWVYEGLTNYLGQVLAARSGLWTEEQFRDKLAEITAQISRPGRTWRPLSDTTRAAQILYTSSDQWASWRRGTDFYSEGTLIWLEADTIIRGESHGAKSLDDFCRRFAGGENSEPGVIPYAFDDVVANLNATAPYDWKGFFAERLSSLSPHPPTAGITASGWQLVYSEEPNAFARATESFFKRLDQRYSTGLLIAEDGAIVDVVTGSPAARAGASPGMKLLAVNHRKFAPEVLRQAVRLGKGSSAPLDLIFSDDQYFLTLHLQYDGGERYPHLVREQSHPDVLKSILSPVVPSK